MDNRNINKSIIAGVFLILLVLTSVSVLAYGVSRPYHKNNPLFMSPGDTKNVEFTLVNNENDPQERAMVSLTKGGEIAQIISGSEYTIIPGTTDSKVVIRISIPESTAIGTEYLVEFTTRAISEQQGTGTVTFGVEYNIDFPVRVVEEQQVQPISGQENQPPTITSVEEFGAKRSSAANIITGIAIVIIVIVIILLFYLIMRNKKR